MSTMDYLRYIVKVTEPKENIPIVLHVVLEGGWYPEGPNLTEEEVAELSLLSGIPPYFWTMLDFIRKTRKFNCMEDC